MQDPEDGSGAIIPVSMVESLGYSIAGFLTTLRYRFLTTGLILFFHFIIIGGCSIVRNDS